MTPIFMWTCAREPDGTSPGGADHTIRSPWHRIRGMSARLATAVREDTLRVGIDGATWTNPRGYGRHTRSVVSARLRCARQSLNTLFSDSLADGDLPSTSAEVRRVRAAGSTRDLPPGARRSLRDTGAMSRALSDPSFHVVLFPTVASYVPVL